MKLANATVLITGANRGLGLAFAREALARDARKVYAGVGEPTSVTLPGVEAIRLDVTRDEDGAAAARHCGDVDLLINNAGIANFGGFLDDGSIESARAHLETDFFGPQRLSKAFAPGLAAHGGGHVGFVDTDLVRTPGHSQVGAQADRAARLRRAGSRRR